MVVTKPVAELIADLLVSRVLAVREENGYPFNIRQVARANRMGDEFRYAHLSVRVDQPAAVRVVELDCPGNPPAICWEQQYDLVCYCRNSHDAVSDEDGESEQPFMTNVNDLAASVHKAITAATNWHTMGGYAFDANLGEVQSFTSDDNEYQGAVVSVSALYRVSETNPYEVRA